MFAFTALFPEPQTSQWDRRQSCKYALGATFVMISQNFLIARHKCFGRATITRHNIKHVLWRAIVACVAFYSRPDQELVFWIAFRWVPSLSNLYFFTQKSICLEPMHVCQFGTIFLSDVRAHHRKYLHKKIFVTHMILGENGKLISFCKERLFKSSHLSCP